MLQQELELERSLNHGLATKFEELKVHYDSDSKYIFCSPLLVN